MLYQNTSDLKSSGQVLNMQAPEAGLKSLALDQPRKGRPLHFAYPHFVELSPENSGHSTVLDDGRLVWQLVISSPGAYSLNLIFDKFNLVEGDSLFIYDPSGETVLGAFTAENNKPWGGLATAPVPGEMAVVEWRRQNTGKEGGQIMIGAVNHDFLNVFNHLGLKIGGFGDSGDCHPDMSCYDEEVFQASGRAECKIIVNGTDLCSGTLLNNTRNDGTPYFLTAGHCMGSGTPSPESVVFIFNYEVPQCQDYIEGVSSQTLSGSTLRAFADSLDFCLLEMSGKPPVSYRAYYAGWDLTTTPQTSGYCIHHPQGDVKKIAISTTPPLATTFSSNSLLGNPFVKNSHWNIAEWEVGTTEGGSSGGGLFLSNNQYIGLLSGGAATCKSPYNDYFVRLNKIWDHVSSDDASVQSWLNPDGAQVESLSGFDPNEGAVFRLSHYPKDESPQVVYLNNGTGFWSGNNSMQTTAVAERYNELYSGVLYGIYLMPGINLVNDDGKVNVKVWSGVDLPEVLIGQKSGVSFIGKKNKEVLVMFDSPVSISGPVFVGYEVDNTSPVDSFGVYQMALPEGQENSFFLRQNDEEWKPYSEMESTLVSSALWMDLLVGEAVLLDTSLIDPPDYELRLAPNPASEYLDVYCDQNGGGWATIVDLNGKVVGSAILSITNYKGRVDLPNLTPGVYLLRLSINGREMVQKFVVML
jgi:hypothetical protein